MGNEGGGIDLNLGIPPLPCPARSESPWLAGFLGRSTLLSSPTPARSSVKEVGNGEEKDKEVEVG